MMLCLKINMFRLVMLLKVILLDIVILQENYMEL
nr:MAG TPA: hypothetical protein [Bacteriophage sp.]